MDAFGTSNMPTFWDQDFIRPDLKWDRKQFPNEGEYASRTIYALNVLQSTREGIVAPDIVDQCVDFHMKYLPTETSTITEYIPNHARSNPTHLFDVDLSDEQFNAANDEFFRNKRGFFRRVRSHTWTIFPVLTNRSSSVVIIHSRQALGSSGGSGFTRELDIVVANTLKEQEVERFIYGRLRLVLDRARGFRFHGDRPINLWYPTNGVNLTTSGLRAYEIIRVMISRISHMISEDRLRDSVGAPVLRGLSGDFQPDKVRAEMIGILANRAMQLTDYSTRICLVPVSHVRDRATARAGRFLKTSERSTWLRNMPANNALQYMADTPGSSDRSSSSASNRASRQPTLSPAVDVNGFPVTGLGIRPGNGFQWGFSPVPDADDHWFLVACPDVDPDAMHTSPG